MNGDTTSTATRQSQRPARVIASFMIPRLWATVCQNPSKDLTSTRARNQRIKINKETAKS